MSDDLTKKPTATESDSDRLKLILTIVQRIESHGTILTQLVKRVDGLDMRVGVVESRLDGIDGRLKSIEQTIKRSVHDLDRGQSVLNDAILKINIGFLDVNERLQGLEPPRNPTNSQT